MSDEDARGAGITVTGVGRAGAVPDVFVLEIAAEATAARVSEALSQATEALRRMRAAALAHGVPPEQLSTLNMSANPIYDQDGYVCSLALTVRSGDVDRAGDLLVACTEAGGDHTRLRRTSFEHSDARELLFAAREAAFADALARASRLAVLAGRELGAVRQVRDGTPARGGGDYPMMAMAESDSAAPPVDAGTLDVTASVTVSWAWA